MLTFAQKYTIMKTFRTIVAAMLLTVSATMMADDYTYLTVTQTGGETSFTVSDIQKITFDSTHMLISLSDGTTQSLPLSDLSKMFFSNSQSAIWSTETSQSKISVSQGVIRALVARGESVTIYNLKGEAVFTSNTDADIDLKSFAKGIYIVKVGTESMKLMNR